MALACIIIKLWLDYLQYSVKGIAQQIV